MTVIFNTIPDLFSLRRAIEQQANDDNVCCDGAEFVVSDIEILDFRVNQWVNLEARSQLYSGCFLTAIRDPLTSTSAGAVDHSSKTSLQRVLGFAMDAQRMFEVLDADGEGVLKMKGFLKVLRRDIDYAVQAFSVLDPVAEGTVPFQRFVTMYHEREHKSFFSELKKRIEHGGQKRGDDGDDIDTEGERNATASVSATAGSGTATAIAAAADNSVLPDSSASSSLLKREDDPSTASEDNAQSIAPTVQGSVSRVNAPSSKSPLLQRRKQPPSSQTNPPKLPSGTATRSTPPSLPSPHGANSPVGLHAASQRSSPGVLASSEQQGSAVFNSSFHDPVPTQYPVSSNNSSGALLPAMRRASTIYGSVSSKRTASTSPAKSNES